MPPPRSVPAPCPVQPCLKVWLHRHAVAMSLDLDTLMGAVAMGGVHTLQLLAWGFSAEELSGLHPDLPQLQTLADDMLSAVAEKRGRRQADLVPVHPVQPRAAALASAPLGLSMASKPVTAMAGLPAASGHAVTSQSLEANASRFEALNLINILRTLGAQSSLWQTMSTLPSEALQQQYLTVLTETLAQFDHRGLASVRAAWLRWSAWCSDHAHAPNRPSTALLTLFLDSVKSRGPSVAKGLLAKFKFLDHHLGAGFNAKTITAPVGPARLRMPAAEATCILPRDLLFIVWWTRCENELTAFFACAVVTMILCSIRFRHAQRTSFEDNALTTMGLCGCVSKGKKRESKAAAPGFRWVAPNWTPAVGLSEPVANFHKQWLAMCGATGAELMLPQFRCTSIFQAKAVTNSAMKYSQFVTFLNELADRCPWGSWPAKPAESCKLGARSLRRLMATLAQVCLMPLERRWALGEWKPPPAGSGGKAFPQATPMPLLYVANKLELESDARKSLLPNLSNALATLSRDETQTMANASWSKVLANKDVAQDGEDSSSSSSTSSSDSDSSKASGAGSTAKPLPIVQVEATIAWVAAPATKKHRHMPSAAGVVAPKCDATSSRAWTLGEGRCLARETFPKARWCKRCALDLALESDDAV